MNDSSEAAAAFRSTEMFCRSPPRRRQISDTTAAPKPSDAAAASATRNGVTMMGSAPSNAGALIGARPVMRLRLSKASREAMHYSSGPV